MRLTRHCQYVLICVKRLRVFVHFPSFFLHVLLRYTRCGKEHKWTHVLRLCLTCFTVWTDQGPVIWKACPLSRDDYIRSYFPALLGGYLKPKPLLVGTCLLLPPHLPYPQISSSGTHSPPAPLLPNQSNLVSYAPVQWRKTFSMVQLTLITPSISTSNWTLVLSYRDSVNPQVFLLVLHLTACRYRAGGIEHVIAVHVCN